MLYPFMTLPDETEIVHSESYYEDGRERVRVEIEKPVDGGFKTAYCLLPDYVWQNDGFSEEELEKLKELIGSLAHVIIGLARDGGFENASVF